MTTDPVLRLLVARVLADLLGQADADARSDVRTSWMVGDRKGAVLSGSPVGSVQLRKGARRAVVTDPAAFEAWAYAQHADNVELIQTTRVRPAYQAAILAAAKATGAAVTGDGEEIPGVAVTETEPTVAVTLADHARTALAEAWASGELWEIVGSLLPALEPAGGDGS